MRLFKQISHFFVFLLVWVISKFFSFLNIKTASKIKYHKSYKTAVKNINYIMPELSDKEVILLAEDSIRQLGMTAAEFLCIDQINESNYHEFVEFEDLDKFTEIYKKYKKIIVVSAHYGNWEIAPKITNMFGMPFHLVYRYANNGFVDNLINEIRSSYTAGSFNKSMTGSRALISTIKKSDNMILCMLMDQKMNNGVKSIFLGKEAYSSSAAADLSLKYNMPIVMAKIERIGMDCKFRINIEETYDDFNISANIITDKMNLCMSNWVLKSPYQWMWVHNRWKKWCR